MNGHIILPFYFSWHASRLELNANSVKLTIKQIIKIYLFLGEMYFVGRNIMSFTVKEKITIV